MLTPAQQRLAAGLLLASPYLPLIFMGEEYGETRPFPFFCSFLDTALQEAVRQGRMEEHSHSNGHESGPDPHSELTFYRSQLTWSWPDNSHAAGLRRLYRDLLTIRRTWTVFRDVHNRQADLLPNAQSPQILRFVRGATSPQASGTLVAYFNLTSKELPLDPTCHPDSQLLLSSEQQRYRGGRRPDDLAKVLMPFEFQFYGPRSWKRP
jgi:maltooligosyltrehalose trehalohydrolase